MPIHNSPSTTRSDAREGFTLLEIVIAIAVLGVLMGAVFQAFLGVRKTQGQAVTQATMKLEGQALLQKLTVEMGQLRHLMMSLDTSPDTEDIGGSYYGQLELSASRVTPMPAGNVRLPRICQTSTFNNLGDGVGQMKKSWFGNAIIFVKRHKALQLATDKVDLKVGNTGTRLLTVDNPFRLNTYTLVAYFMDEHVRSANEPTINGLNHTYGLVRWESYPFVDLNEIQGMFTLVPDDGDKLLVWQDLKAQDNVVRAWDSAALEAKNAFCKLNPSTMKFEPQDEPIACNRLDPALRLSGMEPYAKGFLSFNTDQPGTKFHLPDFVGSSDLGKGLDVPRYGEEQDVVPYGFEVGVMGPNAGRAILVRLSLAAKLSSGQHMYGMSQQTIIQAMDN